MDEKIKEKMRNAGWTEEGIVEVEADEEAEAGMVKEMEQPRAAPEMLSEEVRRMQNEIEKVLQTYRYLRYMDAIAGMVIENGADGDNEVVAELLNAIDVLRREKKAEV